MGKDSCLLACGGDHIKHHKAINSGGSSNPDRPKEKKSATPFTFLSENVKLGQAEMGGVCQLGDISSSLTNMTTLILRIVKM